jgi:hypothetical protein
MMAAAAGAAAAPRVLPPQQPPQPPVRQFVPVGGPADRPPPPPLPPLQQQQHQQQERGYGGGGYGGGGYGGGGAAGGYSAATGGHSSYGHAPRRRHHGHKMMDAYEIDQILRIQYAATHGGHPYSEDYYHQAWANRHLGARNARAFAPEALRELLGQQGAAAAGPPAGTPPRPGSAAAASGNGEAGSNNGALSAPRVFADLSGLGKVVLNNIRTPRMLMDVGGALAGGASSGNGGGGGIDGDAGGWAKAGKGGKKGAATASAAAAAPAVVAHRPLQQEPLLAARIMVEDCVGLLLDVDDIDRTFAQAVALAHDQGAGAEARRALPAGAADLRARRSALLCGIIRSLRVQESNAAFLAIGGGGGAGGGKKQQQQQQGAAAAAAAAAQDRVLRRVVALSKGRALLSRALRLLHPPRDAAAAADRASPLYTGGLGGRGLGVELLLAVLRNYRALFGAGGGAAAAGGAGASVGGAAAKGAEGEAAADARRRVDATVSLAEAAAEAVRRLTAPSDVAFLLQGFCQAAAAAAAGGGGDEDGGGGARGGNNNASSSSSPLLPLHASAGGADPASNPPWLGHVLATLLLRGQELGLGAAGEAGTGRRAGAGAGGGKEEAELAALAAADRPAPEAQAAWSRAVKAFGDLYLAHLAAVRGGVKGGGGGGAAAAGASAAPALLACKETMRALMPAAGPEQQAEIRAYMDVLR